MKENILRILLWLIGAAVVIMGVASCNDNPQIQLELNNGRVIWADNPNMVSVSRGDTVVLYQFISRKSTYSKQEIFGYYRGDSVIPEGDIDSIAITSYSSAIVIR